MSILNVNSSDCYLDLAHAVAAAHPYDELHIKGVVTASCHVEIKQPLQLIGVGETAMLNAHGLLPPQTGILTTCSDVVVRNIEFAGARSRSGNGAGVWHRGGNLSLEDCTFTGNQNGVLIADGSATAASFLRCRFKANGGGCGHTHGIYANKIRQLVVEWCSFEGTVTGHDVKSRAEKTRVENSYFSEPPTGTTSLAVDIPNGGSTIIRRNFMVKSRDSMSRKFISFGSEGRVYHQNSLTVSSNTFINYRRGITVAVANYSSIRAIATGNAFEGVTFALIGRGRNQKKRNAAEAIAAGATS